jgi:hypothetical protein
VEIEEFPGIYERVFMDESTLYRWLPGKIGGYDLNPRSFDSSRPLKHVQEWESFNWYNRFLGATETSIFACTSQSIVELDKRMPGYAVTQNNKSPRN